MILIHCGLSLASCCHPFQCHPCFHHIMDDKRFRSCKTWVMHALHEPNFAWSPLHRCHYCHIQLFTGETPGICCGLKGSHLHDVQPLPPLPVEFEVFINDPNISPSSRILNLIFAFVCTECTAEFLSFRGPPCFFAVHGRLYHCVRPTHCNSAVRWLLYDGFLPKCAPHQHWKDLLPPQWIHAFTAALLQLNPLVQSLRQLTYLEPASYPHAHLILQDQGSSPEVRLCLPQLINTVV